MHLLLNFLLLIGGVVTAGVGLVMARANPMSWGVAALGVASVLLAFVSDSRRVKRRDARVAGEVADRISALTRRPWMLHERLELPPNRAMALMALGAVILGGGAAYLGFSAAPTKWALMLGGLLIFGIGVLVAPVALAGIGKPALVLDRSGFRTPVDGPLPWHYVDGIHLQVIEHRGVKNYSLMFRVPDYANAASSVHWSQRWLAPFGLGGLRRGVVAVVVRSGKERPETVEAVARHLWRTATDRDWVWNPNLSAEANDAYRRMAQFQKRFDDKAGIDREIKANPGQALEDFRKFTQDMDVVRTDVAKKSRLVNWVILVALVGMLLSIAWPLLRR
jgi:hypothetical protein